MVFSKISVQTIDAENFSLNAIMIWTLIERYYDKDCPMKKNMKCTLGVKNGFTNSGYFTL